MPTYIPNKDCNCDVYVEDFKQESIEDGFPTFQSTDAKEAEMTLRAYEALGTPSFESVPEEGRKAPRVIVMHNADNTYFYFDRKDIDDMPLRSWEQDKIVKKIQRMLLDVLWERKYNREKPQVIFGG